MPPTPIPKQVRFAEFIRRLSLLPAASSHDEARSLIDQTLNRVEDELSGVPFDPEHWKTDGRMYPVQDDNATDAEGAPGVTSYRSVAHETLIAPNGAFEIRNVKTDTIEISKPGADGKGVLP